MIILVGSSSAKPAGRTIRRELKLVKLQFCSTCEDSPFDFVKELQQHAQAYRHSIDWKLSVSSSALIQLDATESLQRGQEVRLMSCVTITDPHKNLTPMRQLRRTNDVSRYFPGGRQHRIHHNYLGELYTPQQPSGRAGEIFTLKTGVSRFVRGIEGLCGKSE
jgi:hypothetical protein